MRSHENAAALWVRLAKCYGIVLGRVRRIESMHGLTIPQFDALAQLLRHREGMTLKALSEALLVTAGNVTGVVARLRSKGLLRRETHPRDGRASILKLTPAGERISSEEIRRHERGLKRIFSNLGARERKKIQGSLDLLRAALES